MSEKFKEMIVAKLGSANDCEEVKQVLNSYLDNMSEKNLQAGVIGGCLINLKVELKTLSPSAYDYLHWCNIRCAILHLKGLIDK
jgi:hypothetical protein